MMVWRMIRDGSNGIVDVTYFAPHHHHPFHQRLAKPRAAVTGGAANLTGTSYTPTVEIFSRANFPCPEWTYSNEREG